jgi:hypothetical protein
MLLLDGIPLRLRPAEFSSVEIEDQALLFAKCTDSIVLSDRPPEMSGLSKH